jgi:hypothetical protein
MDKSMVPPSGDKHDFLRLPTYQWPNPETPDGLPYIHRDGERNPATMGPETDMKRMSDLADAVTALGWGALATDAEAYARRAAELLRVWFLDPETAMNPNLTYAKVTPGQEPPYPTGVIATHRWVPMVQACGLLAATDAWTAELDEGLRDWFGRYVAWLETSEQGLAERRMANNRGIWYEAQVAVFARFAGAEEPVRRAVATRAPRRLDEQIAPDGSLPAELKRTISLTYSLMTMRAWTVVALAADTFGVDLWHRTTADGRGLRLAFQHLSPYLANAEAWPHEQIKPPGFGGAVFPWSAAAEVYGDAVLGEALRRLPETARRRQPEAHLFRA